MKHRASPLNPATKRRTFLKAAVAGGGVSALLCHANASTAVTDLSTPQAVPDTPAESSGYRETDHIKAYYRTARE